MAERLNNTKPIYQLLHYVLMKNDSTSYQIVLGAWLIITATVFGLNMNALSPVVASVDRSSLLLVDLHLDECIKQLQLGNTENALEHCQLADQQLEKLLSNNTE
ncbi:MAG: hypothetical protein WBL68_14370 [Nitrososphaeraceae archaeon]